MADAALLALLGNEDLSSFASQVGGSDINSLFQQALGAYQPDVSGYGAGGQLANSFGKAFLSGYLGNRARENVTSQLRSVANVLPQLTSDPLGTVAPEGINQDAFAQLQAKAAIRKAANEQALGRQGLDFRLDLLKNAIGEGVKDGQYSAADAVKAIASGDFSSLMNPSDGPATENPKMSALLDAHGIEDPKVRAALRTPQELSTFVRYPPGGKAGKGEKGSGLPPSMIPALADSKALIDEARGVAEQLGSVKSWSDLQKMQAFSGLDTDGINARISNLADQVLRSRSGAAAPDSEKAALRKIVAGDFTAGPTQAARLLNKFADAEARSVVSQVDFANKLGGGGIEEIKTSLAPTKVIGGRTYIKVAGGWQAQ